MDASADVIVIGAGLAGLVATSELVAAGRKVTLLDQEPEASLGGQAFWSLGGLFMVNTPEQRWMGIRDSHDLALQDWMGSAGFDREEDRWPRLWAEAHVAFAAGEMRPWLRGLGLRFFPIVGWAERGGYGAMGPGNSVPRFHITWGTGPGVMAPFERLVREAAGRGLVDIKSRHRVDEIVMRGGSVDGVRGHILEPSAVERGAPSSRVEVGEFAFNAQAVVVTSGGIGGSPDLVRDNWPDRLGNPPRHMLSGVPKHVDGRMLAITEGAGGRVINRDRMWHYTEGVQNWRPIWKNHGIRILPGPSSMWLDALGKRLPPPLFPGFDTLGTLEHITNSGFEHTWFVLNQAIIEKEFALSGSEQNPDLTNRNLRLLAARLMSRGRAPHPVEAFKRHGADFVVEPNLHALVGRMNALTAEPLLDGALVEREIIGRDREVDNRFSKDPQIVAIHGARKYRGDRMTRVAKPRRLLDPAAGPLIAVRLHILTRKTLGGLQTDLKGRVLGLDGEAVPGLYASGEVAGFGGGGMHGYRALEGTFLGGCLFSGRVAGRAVADAVM
jgi:uncharacterized protein